MFGYDYDYYYLAMPDRVFTYRLTNSHHSLRFFLMSDIPSSWTRLGLGNGGDGFGVRADGHGMLDGYEWMNG